MNARDKRIALQRATIQTLIAIAASGCRFYDAIGLGFGPSGTDTLAVHVKGWQASVAAAVCTSYAEACSAAAFGIEADDASGRMRGFRLFRLGGGDTKTGHMYSGETFRTADDLWSAMRTLADMREHPACAPIAPPAAAPHSIEVIGRLWFDKPNGNTYHRAVIIIDGIEVHRTAFDYGYGDQYLESAAAWLESNGILPMRERYRNGGRASLRTACEAAGLKLTHSTVDVSKRGAL